MPKVPKEIERRVIQNVKRLILAKNLVYLNRIRFSADEDSYWFDLDGFDAVTEMAETAEEWHDACGIRATVFNSLVMKKIGGKCVRFSLPKICARLVRTGFLQPCHAGPSPRFKSYRPGHYSQRYALGPKLAAKLCDVRNRSARYLPIFDLGSDFYRPVFKQIGMCCPALHSYDFNKSANRKGGFA